MGNPEKILRTLDGLLKAPLELVIYGRSAIALGFPSNPDAQATLDVDVLIPLQQLEFLRHNDDFWNAQEQVNKLLEPEQLYITHLFSEEDVVIRPDWFAQKIEIPLQLSKIHLFRPATIDLILTKMMREDPLDLADIEFLLTTEPEAARRLPAAIETARIPSLCEISEIFHRLKPKVLTMAGLRSRNARA